VTRTLRSAPALLVLLATAACASGGASAASDTSALAPAANRQAAAACTATVPGRDLATWTEATWDDLTICLPPGWRVRGGLAQSGTAQVRWGRGEPKAEVVRTEIRTVPASEMRRINRDVVTSNSREFPETIGGQQAIVQRRRVGERFYTGAVWNTPRVWIGGEASTEAAAEVQMTIIRSARLPAQ
jgi:hypothetical protein